jgi:protein-L-isoaspartate(D-aspartate) O-methyltransferase
MDRFAEARCQMVKDQIQRRGLRDPALLAAFRTVPRHLFVPAPLRAAAYDDTPLAVGSGQTISQPYIVALMTVLLELEGGERILEVGTGSGYQAAILSALSAEVYTVELLPALKRRSERILRRLGCRNVHVREGDGSLGWPEVAPFAGILVTAAAPAVPPPLLRQLREGGKLVIPVEHGEGYQMLKVFTCDGGSVLERDVTSVAFVPLRGEYGQTRR